MKLVLRWQSKMATDLSNKTEEKKDLPVKTYEGSQIKGLFSRPQSVDIVVKHETYGNIKFVIRPMNNDIYARMGEAMKASGIDVENVSNIDALKVFSNVYYPAMKIVFPYCCITPKIIDGISKEEGTLSLTDVPMDVLMDLFNQIMENSGLSKKSEDERKN